MSDDTWDVLAALARNADQVNAVEHDRFNLRAFVGARREINAIFDMVNKFTMTEDYALEFLQDIFYLLIKGDPQVRPLHDMRPTHIPNHIMIEEFAKYPELLALREHTANRLISTAMAELSMETEIQQAFDAMKAARELAEQLQQLLDDARALAAQSRFEVEAGNDTTELDSAFDAILTLADTLMQQLQSNATQAAQAAATGLRSAARQASNEAGKDQDMLSAYGVEPGVFQRLSFTQRADLMQRLRKNRIADFAKLIGAFQNVADAQWRKRVTAVPDEIANVTFGDDLTRMVPTELMNLALPETRMEFLRRYTSRRLLEFEVRGKERQGLGPMVLVCDESGSMTCPLGGATREAWAKAFCLALVEIARKQKRPVTYIGYSSRFQQRTVDLTTHDLEAVLDMTEGFLNGGTHYETPLLAAVDLIHQGNMGRADIVFISDDEYYTPDEDWIRDFKERLMAVSAACHGVLIGSEESGAMGTLCTSMRSVCDVMPGTELDQATDVFGKIL